MTKTNIQLHDKTFKLLLPADDIQRRAKNLAEAIYTRHSGETPLFLGVLNGAFMFVADLMRYYPGNCEISFVKVASYSGMKSTGAINTLIGVQVDLKDRHVYLIEDIVDSGQTLHELLPRLWRMEPKTLEVVTLLSKPYARRFDVPVLYKGFEIGNEFVVGYGLDYDGLGRNLSAIYVLDE